MVPAVRSPTRRNLGSISMLNSATVAVPGSRSTTISRFRTAEAGRRTGVPSSCTTCRPSTRLPIVWPSLSTSNSTGYSHWPQKTPISITPEPNFPATLSPISSATPRTPRPSQSTSSASARGTTPAGARRKVTPSGVSTMASVSSAGPTKTVVPRKGCREIIPCAAARAGSGRQRRRHRPRESRAYWLRRGRHQLRRKRTRTAQLQPAPGTLRQRRIVRHEHQRQR